MRAKKSLGQNFLMHAQTARRIVAAASLPKDATVLEIGPGTGMLTAELLKSTHHVIAVEADGELIPRLTERFTVELKRGALTLVHNDIRSVDLTILPRPYHVVANIPYYITGELFRMLLSAKNKPASLTVLVQKEVAERIARSKKESLLSLSIKVYGTPRYAFTVPRGAFVPAPKVDSAVLVVEGIAQSAFENPEEEERFFELIHAGFAHKRKRLAGNLSAYAPKEQIAAACKELHIPEHVRAEDLSLSMWRALAQRLKK